MHRTDYKNWNLHDAELLSVKHIWDDKSVEISLIAFIDSPITNTSCELLLEDVVESKFSHNSPWGDSKYIYSFEVTIKTNGYNLSIQMSSGDVLKFECKNIKLVYEEFKTII